MATIDRDRTEIECLPAPEEWTIPELCELCEDIVLHQVRAHRNQDDGSVSYPRRKNTRPLQDESRCASCKYYFAITEGLSFNFAVSMSKGSAGRSNLLIIALT
jgi:hypothetical protein